MKRIDLVNKIDQEYGLMNLFKQGIVQWTELRDRDIFLQYDVYIKLGKPIMDAKETAASDFKVSIETVHRAIKKMNEEIRNSYTGTKREA